MNKEFLIEGLLRFNYLPAQRREGEELPPIFCTSSFTKEVAEALAALPERTHKKDKCTGYDQIEYRLTRFNGVSRYLSIPHPLAHAKLCLCIEENWDSIDYIVKNQNSQIKPQSHSDGRVIIMNAYDHFLTKVKRNLFHSFGKSYRVHADIANCFSSIYSHAVAWALVGTEYAKENKTKKAEWFNKIDQRLMRCKRDETQGIAIGPAVIPPELRAFRSRVTRPWPTAVLA